MKPSLNQPCPCGSDKKYKLCCEGKLSPELEDYYGLLQKEGILKKKIFQWMTSRFSPDELDELTQQFTGNTFEDSRSDEDNFPFFLDWLLFEGTIPETGKPFLTTAHEEVVFDPTEQEILKQWIEHTQAGVYEIQEANPSKNYLTIKEIFTGKEYEITDVQGSKSGVRGDVFFGRVQQLFSNYYLSGVLQAIPRANLLQLKEHLRKKHLLARLKNPLLSYEKFINRSSGIIFLFSPPMPPLCNPSGETITVCEATYSLLEPHTEEIVAWLAQDKRVLITAENYGRKGTIVSAELGYLADKESDSRKGGLVVFSQWINGEGQKYSMDANISIKNNKVILFSQSQKTYLALRQKIEAQFGSSLKLEQEQQKPVAEVLAEINTRQPKPSHKRKRVELQEAEEQFYLQYYQKEWCDTKIPLLGDKTPREAVCSEEGKKKVKQLLLDLENEQLHRKREGEKYLPIEKILCEELGIHE